MEKTAEIFREPDTVRGCESARAKQASYGIGILLRDLGVYYLVSHIQSR